MFCQSDKVVAVYVGYISWIHFYCDILENAFELYRILEPSLD